MLPLREDVERRRSLFDWRFGSGLLAPVLLAVVENVFVEGERRDVYMFCWTGLAGRLIFGFGAGWGRTEEDVVRERLCE
jgi:hypothetical protein